MFRFVFSVVLVMHAAAQQICKLDVALVVDSSGSIWVNQPIYEQGRLNWEAVRNFTGDLVRDFSSGGPFGLDVNAIAALQFEDAGDTRLVFNFQELSPSVMESTMRSLPYDQNGGTTRMDRAMEILNRDVFVSTNPGNSPEASDVAIIITDGRITDGFEERTIELVNEMKRRGVEFIMVGVTNQTDIEQLERIASNPSSVFSVNEFSELESLLGSIQEQACDIVRECPAPDPYAVAFSALSSPDGMVRYMDGMIMPFGLATLNVGLHYDSNNYIFTCPCRGLYEFHLTLSYLHQGLMAAIVKNGMVASPIAYTDKGSMSTTSIILCDVGETVYAQVIHADGLELMPCWYNNNAFHGFTGKLISTIN